MGGGNSTPKASPTKDNNKKVNNADLKTYAELKVSSTRAQINQQSKLNTPESHINHPPITHPPTGPVKRLDSFNRDIVVKTNEDSNFSQPFEFQPQTQIPTKPMLQPHTSKDTPNHSNNMSRVPSHHNDLNQIQIQQSSPMKPLLQPQILSRNSSHHSNLNRLQSQPGTLSRAVSFNNEYGKTFDIEPMNYNQIDNSGPTPPPMLSAASRRNSGILSKEELESPLIKKLLHSNLANALLEHQEKMQIITEIPNAFYCNTCETTYNTQEELLNHTHTGFMSNRKSP